MCVVVLAEVVSGHSLPLYGSCLLLLQLFSISPSLLKIFNTVLASICLINK
jgi:hypothetical protein